MQDYNKKIKEINEERDILIKIANEFITITGKALAILETLKEDLIKIILDSNYSPEDKISKIRNKILESKSQESNIDDELHKHINKDMSPKLLERVNELIRAMTNTYHENSKFRDQIADAIRNKEMSPQDKIEEISNILM